MPHFTRLLCFAFALLLACPAPTTSVRLRLEYDEAWPLSAFVLTARDKTVRLHASSADGTKTREFIVSIPPEWVGEAVTYTVRAYVGVAPRDELYASGHTTVTAIEGQTVDEVIVFARSACATWCTPGATFCRNGGVMVCEMSETGCPRWGTPALCSDGQSCSLGECNTQCVNECAEGETRCSGPSGVEICGQSDNDACLDWQQPILCEGAQICSNGRCSGSCMSECTAGSVRCRDGGLSMCADSNSDGCFEWGPSVSCAAGDSCTGNEGMPNAAGVAHCQARTSCMDSCTANTCANNTFTTCGNFNLDSCREPSAGTNCASANPCEEGVCDLTANGGMGGCLTRPRNTPECTGQCAGQAANSPCNDNNSCTTSDSCRAGLCTGAPVNCTAGREPTCENGVARTYASAGMCMNGTCQYSVVSEETCANGCEGNRCAADPCESVSCPALPNVRAQDQVCYVRNSGTCLAGTCSFEVTTSSCDDGNSCTVSDACSNGVCAGTPMNCTAGREPTCGNGVARTYYSAGMCVSGACHYSIASEETCTSGCAGTRCATPMPGTSQMQIAAGKNHNCALLQDRTVRCWGNGLFGQLGNGTTNITSQSTPIAVDGLSNVNAIAIGGYHSCALLQGGTVRCWGNGSAGQLGYGSVNQSRPVPVTGLSDVTAITAGGFHTCALLGDRTVRCWGNGISGQLGYGNDDQSAPVQVTNLSNAIAITAGERHTCALLEDRTLRCWGDGLYGQLGNNGVDNSNLPVTVSGVSQASAVSAGANHTCALLQGGTVRCWGRGNYGQLGNNSTDHRTTAVTVANLTGVSAVSSGERHTCALLQDHTIRCWGNGVFGQLGDGGTADHSTPVAGTELNNVVAVSASGLHTCALLQNSTAFCWGHGQFGELGNGQSGTDYFETTPVAVIGIP